MLKTLLSVFWACLFSSMSLAADTIAAKKSLIQWYEPSVLSESTNLKEVSLSGQATPGAQITVTRIQHVTTGDKPTAKSLDLKQVFESTQAEADDDGRFELKAKLPIGLIQITMQVKLSENVQETYQLQMEIQKEQIMLRVKDPLLVDPNLDKKNLIWGGLGFNYHKYSVAIPGSIDVSHDNYTFPMAVYLAYNRKFGSEFAVDFSTKIIPGQVKQSSDIPVRNGQYTWRIMALDTIYRPKFLFKNISGLEVNSGFRIGYQYNQVPFIYASSQEVAVEMGSLSMLSMGLDLAVNQRKKVYYEGFMRYLQPLSSSSRYKITPKMSFDGSIGTVMKLSSSTRIGLYWYGELINTTLSGENINTGEQNLFFTNIEIRLGYQF